jgi:AraC-like DNA-binding protein
MGCHQRPPAPPLDAFIESIWLYENDPKPWTLQRILPTGAAQLIVNLKEDATRSYGTGKAESCTVLPGTILSGVATRFQIIDTAEQEYVLGVSFRPGGTVAFFRAPASEMRDVDVPLETLWDPYSTALLREKILSTPLPEAKLDVVERALAAVWQARSLHPAVAFALDCFRRRPHVTSIGTVTDAISLSAKRFIEHFKSEVGVTPKRYCRILRFQRAVACAHPARYIDWSQLALACGYFDQAHFIHDFRAFAGVTPTAYQASRTEFQNHVTFLQSDAYSAAG